MPVEYRKKFDFISGLNYYWAAAPYPIVRVLFVGYPYMGLLRSGIYPAVPGNTDADKYNNEFWDIELAAPTANFYPRLNTDGLRLFVGFEGNINTGKIEVLKKISGKVESEIFTCTDFRNHNLAGAEIHGVEVFNFHTHPDPVKFKIKVLEDFS